MATKNEMMKRIEHGQFATLTSANIAIGKSKFRSGTKTELKLFARKWFAGYAQHECIDGTGKEGELEANGIDTPAVIGERGKVHQRRAMAIALLYLNDRARKLTLDYMLTAREEGLSLDDMIAEMSHSLGQLNGEGS